MLLYNVVGISAFSTAVLASPPPGSPKFAADWSSGDSQFNVMYQGDFIEDPNLGFCCGQSSNCEVQTGYSKGEQYYSSTTKQFRYDDKVQNAIFITDYLKLKEVQTDENLVCVSFCPVIGGLPPYQLDPSDEDFGVTTIDGVQVHHWAFNITGPFNVTMQNMNTYVNQSDFNNANPVKEYDTLTPFKVDLGYFNETYSNWVAGPQAKALFNYTEGPNGCPKANNCNSNEAMMRRYAMGDFATFAKLAKERGLDKPLKEQVREISQVRRNLKGPHRLNQLKAIPTLPQDYAVANEVDFLVLPQGDYQVVHDSGMDYWCCSTKSNCKIQTEFQAAPSYVSSTLQMTRMGGPLGSQAVVTDFTKQMEYGVDGNNTCQSYCPLQQQPFYNLTIESIAVDKGPATLDGTTYEHFYWEDKILKKVAMDAVDAYVDLSDPANPKPYLWAELIEPFNQYLANANTTYNGFVGGPQDPKLFAVNGIQGCPLNQNCQSDD